MEVGEWDCMIGGRLNIPSQLFELCSMVFYFPTCCEVRGAL